MMEKRRLLGIAVLLLATLAALVCADRKTEEPAETWGPEAAMTSEEARHVLRDYFAAQYSEAGCSAIYVDLTHDGVDELLVMEMGPDRNGEPVLLHGGAVDASRFKGGRVTVYQAEKSGVSPLYEFACGTEGEEQGGLYLQEQEGLAWLLRSEPKGKLEVFSLGDRAQSLEAIITQGAKPILVYERENILEVNFAYLDELFTSY